MADKEPEKKDQDVSHQAKKAKLDSEPESSQPKIFGGSTSAMSGFGSFGSTSASPFSALASNSSSVFGEGSSKLSFSSFSSDKQNVFASDPGAGSDAKDDSSSSSSSSSSTWVSPFSTESFGQKNGAKSEKNGVEAEKASEFVSITGEEEENTEFSIRSRLYFFDQKEKKDWREKGVGALKLNTNRKSKAGRLVMRSDGNMRLILNVSLYDGIVMELASDKSVRFVTLESDQTMTTYLIRTRSKEDAKSFIKAVKQRVQITEPPKRETPDVKISDGTVFEKSKSNALDPKSLNPTEKDKEKEKEKEKEEEAQDNEDQDSKTEESDGGEGEGEEEGGDGGKRKE